MRNVTNLPMRKLYSTVCYISELKIRYFLRLWCVCFMLFYAIFLVRPSDTLIKITRLLI